MIKTETTMPEVLATIKPDIEPGLYIPPSRIEEWSGTERYHRDYSIYIRRLIGMLNGLDDSIWCHQDDYGIRFMTEPEKMAYMTAGVESGLKKAVNVHITAEVKIDPGKLSSHEQDIYAKIRFVNARKLMHAMSCDDNIGRPIATKKNRRKIEEEVQKNKTEDRN